VGPLFKRKNLLFIFTLLIIITAFILWQFGLIGLWHQGMSYIVNNTERYTDAEGHILQGDHSISIDLSDLESNIGKELYNDGVHRIYVGWIDNTGNINSGGYRIGFRSSGEYSLSGASLISGIHHETVGESTFTSNMSASMTAEYNGETYNSSVFGVSGLNYQDGDDFGFYIFPGESYESNKISLNETGVVRVTVTNLYKNIWSEK
jgi:hypothetical protein